MVNPFDDQFEQVLRAYGFKSDRNLAIRLLRYVRVYIAQALLNELELIVVVGGVKALAAVVVLPICTRVLLGVCVWPIQANL